MKEQTGSPKLTKEQILFTLDKFRKLDLTIEANKERLLHHKRQGTPEAVSLVICGSLRLNELCEGVAELAYLLRLTF